MFKRLVISLLLVASLGAQASAAELVFVELKGCIFCLRFNQQVVPGYKSGRHGELTLRHVDLAKKWPSDLAQVKQPNAAPWFIVVENGREVGRFSGYTGAASFNRKLDGLVRKLVRSRGV